MRRLLFVLVGLVACDPVVDRHTPDAAPGIDAAPDAPTHGMVSVKVYDPNNSQTVVVGVPVVFVEADGTLVGHPTTDTNGVAMADVHTNASATVIITTQGSTQLQTMTALKPNDNIILGPNTPPQVQDGMFTVSFPAYAAGYNYTVYGSCGQYGSTGAAVTMTVYSDCKQATMDLFVVASDTQGNPVAYVEKPNVAYTAGGNAAITGSYQGMQTFTAAYTNANAAITNISMQRSTPDNYGFTRSGSGVPASGTLSLTAIGPQLGSMATIQTYATKGQMQSTVVQKIAGSSLTYGLDLGASLLPWLGQPTFDVTTGKITVPVDTTGTSGDMPDLFYADASYSRTVGTTTTSYSWLVFAPVPADVTLPTMPPEVGDVMPKATDTANGAFAQMVESDKLTSWDQVRADVYTAANHLLNEPHSDAMRIRYSTYGGD